MRKILRDFFCGFGILLLCACIPEIIPYESVLDTPSRHYKNGMKLLHAGKIDASKSEFNRCLEIDREYAPGYVGLGLISGLKGDYSDALDKMNLAGLFTRNRHEAALVHVGIMRIYLMGGEQISSDWLQKTEEHYEKSILLAPEIPDAYYFMGIAYKMALRWDKALQEFLHVVNLNGDFAAEASNHISMIQEREKHM